MKKNHNLFTNLAFNLAEKNLGRTNKNPSVGCVVVKNETVISSGFTSINGRPHAEFNALNRKMNFNGSKMYVTLEPCTHIGQTPPCTNIIKKKKIKTVFYSFNDPDKRTYKKAKKVLKNILKKSKIQIKHKDFYKSYFLNKEKKLPLVDAKIAISKDFFTINKKSKWITNYRSRQVANLLRSKYDCIVSTSETINKDNSLLNCRIEGLEHSSPDLIIIDRNLKLNKNLKLFDLSIKRKIYIFTTSQNKKKLSYFKKKKAKIFIIKKLSNKNDFKNLFKQIFTQGKGRILIESGLVFTNELFKFKLLNNLYIFKTNKNLNINGINNGSVEFIKKIKLKKNINVNLINEKLYKIKIK